MQRRLSNERPNGMGTLYCGDSQHFKCEIEIRDDQTSGGRRAEILKDPGFGRFFTDHMFMSEWTPRDSWVNARVTPYGEFTLDPATAVLHYAQSIFEGTKAYAHRDGSIWTFRSEVNAERFGRSARRLALPELPADWFVGAIEALVRTDRAWVPRGGEASLYIRPFMFASAVFLGVRPSGHVTFCIIASPVGGYFPDGVKPLSIWLSEEYTRAAAGGTGAAKCGANYAAGLLPQQEAVAHRCDQVVFTDSVEHTWIEELSGMNLFFVYDDGSIVTPKLSGSILEGVTRNSLLKLAEDLGHDVIERRFSVEEWRDGVETGHIAEVFACGTAAVVTPVGKLVWSSGETVSRGGGTGPVTSALRRALIDIQYGRAEDVHGWMRRVV